MDKKTQEGQRPDVRATGDESDTTEKINRALQLLDEVAQEKKEAVSQLINEKYSNIKEMMNQTSESYKEVIEKAKQSLAETMVHGEERYKDIVATFDKKIHTDPWPYVIITSIVCLISGLIIGGSRRPGAR
jgi:ElaB/YqjD/DUF883 family membrane-anchored ribosome-binding protein